MPAAELDFSRFTLRGDVPPHRQVAAYLKVLIALGQLAPGGDVPSASALSSRLRVSAGEVRRAYGDLEAGGFLVSKGGTWRISEEQGPGISSGAADAVRQRMEALILEGREAGLSRAALLRLFASLLDR